MEVSLIWEKFNKESIKNLLLVWRNEGAIDIGTSFNIIFLEAYWIILTLL